MSERITADLDFKRNEEAELSQASIDFIDRRLRHKSKLSGIDNPPEISLLIAYLLGEALPDDARTLELLLTRDTTARALLRRVDRAVERMRQTSWDDIVQLAAAPERSDTDLDRRVALLWIERLNRQMSVTPARLSRSWRRFRGWSGFYDKESTGDSTRALERATLNALLRESLQPRTTHSTFAVVRGASLMSEPQANAISVFGMPAYYRAAVVEIAEVTEDGAFHVSVALQVADRERASRPRRGEKIHLELSVCGQDWLLHETIVKEDRAEWTIPNFGATIGIAPGPLNASRLTLRFGGTARRISASDVSNPILAPTYPQFVIANVFESNGRRNPAQPQIDLVMPVAPTFDNGQLRISIALSPADRFAFASYRLNLDLAVTSERSQRLASFPMSGWPEDGAVRTLSVPWPGASMSRMHAALAVMLLYFSLQARAGSGEGNPEK